MQNQIDLAKILGPIRPRHSRSKAAHRVEMSQPTKVIAQHRQSESPIHDLCRGPALGSCQRSVANGLNPSNGSPARIAGSTFNPGARHCPAITQHQHHASPWIRSAWPPAIHTVEGRSGLGIQFTQAGHHVMQVLSRQIPVRAPFEAGVGRRLDPGHTRRPERSRAQKAGGEVHGDPPSGVDSNTRTGLAGWPRA